MTRGFGCISNKSERIGFSSKVYCLSDPSSLAPLPRHLQRDALDSAFVVQHFLGASGEREMPTASNQICISVTFPTIKILTIYIKSEIQLLASPGFVTSHSATEQEEEEEWVETEAEGLGQ